MDAPKLKSVPAHETAEVEAPDDDLREPTKAELLEDLRIALRDAIAGKEGIPAREFLEELSRDRDRTTNPTAAND
jgi:hypothetical protein